MENENLKFSLIFFKHYEGIYYKMSTTSRYALKRVGSEHWQRNSLQGKLDLSKCNFWGSLGVVLIESLYMHYLHLYH